MRVVFMGTPEFSVPCLIYLVESHYQVVAVYTRPDQLAGRGRSIISSPVKRQAEVLNLPVVQPSSLKRPEVVAELAGFQPDVIVVAAYGQILPRSVLDLPLHGCLNVHPSLLPKYRGASPVTASILAGDEFAGVSIMLLNEGTDSGPVLARAQIPIEDSDTTGSLTGKLSQVGARLLLDVIPRWCRGMLAASPQDESQATYTSQLTKEEGRIDWGWSALELWRRVRAFNPWPGCYTVWRGRRLMVIEAVALPGDRGIEAGKVIAMESNKHSGVGFGVATGDGILGVLRVQLEGKQAVPAADFLNGQRQFIGAELSD